MFVIQVLLAAGVLAIAFLVYRMVEELRAIRGSIDTLRESLPHGGMLRLSGGLHHWGASAVTKPFAIWIWSGKEWELDHGSIPPNADPGPTPQFPGSYLGHCVKMECR